MNFVSIESKGKPLVSIIVPCYNAEKHLIDTLKSIEKQTYKKIEVICINDGSIDGTIDILKKWHNTTKINNIIINQKNQGVSHSRNVGIEKANGEYIMFLDADDIYDRNIVSTLIEEVTLKNKDTAYCKLDRNEQKFTDLNQKKVVINQSQKDAMKNLLYNMSYISFACYIYNKKIINKHKIKFDENTKYFEDREFNWKYLCWCKNISYVDNIMYFYRKNMESATKMTPVWRKTDSLKAVRRTEEYLKQNNCKFYTELKSYLYSRVVWSIAKTFAVGKQKQLYNKFVKEYNVRKHMRRMLKDKQKSVVIGSILYLINPHLFYFVLSKVNK